MIKRLAALALMSVPLWLGLNASTLIHVQMIPSVSGDTAPVVVHLPPGLTPGPVN